MIKTKPALFLIFLFLAISSCKKSDLQYENEYDKSYKAWLSFKESSGNSYRYTVTGYSWTGISWQTTISVTNGKITRRAFKYTLPVGSSVNIPPDALEWTEDENEINLHPNGAPAITLDEVYEKARSEWLTKRKNAKTYFEAKNNDLISSCGYVEDGCADDCFTGIRIGTIERL